MARKPYFTVDPASFQVMQEDVGIGKIFELSPQDAGLLAPHVEAHPETLFIAASGVNVSEMAGSLLLPGRHVAIEWIREERRPKAGEPECNTYRYLFGMTSDGECVGYDVTERTSSPSHLQVGDHWTTLDEVCKRYLGRARPESD